MTELLRGKLSSLLHEASEDVGDQEMLHKTQIDDQQIGSQRLQASTQELERLDAQLRNYDQEIEVLKSFILANGSSVLDLENFVLTTDPQETLKYKLMAADRAWDDLIRCLEKSLAREQISLQQYVTYVRNCARERFMCKAMLKKLSANSASPSSSSSSTLLRNLSVY